MYGSRRFSSITLVMMPSGSYTTGSPSSSASHSRVRVGDVALLVAVVHAELHLDGLAERALVRKLEAGLGVVGVDCLRLGLGHRNCPLGAVRLLQDLVRFGCESLP